ncbi:MAG: response regulator transcription factor [Chloroflexi bacterium]|nr:response regulator transcription factor [Chloroflexota bacterium]
MRILIADDHGVLRGGLRALLNAEADMQVIGEAADGHEALRFAAETIPDIVLLDIGMPGLDGIQVTRRMKELLPAGRVLILTLHEDLNLMREAIRAGASGYIIKRAADLELINAVRAISRGEMYVHPAMTQALLEELRAPAAEPDTAPLTAREVEVLRLIVKGYTNRQIADTLMLSVRTVDNHRANLMGKLNMHSRQELVRYAMEHDLL